MFPNLITALADAGDMLPVKDDRDFFSSDALTYAYRLVHFGLKRIEDEKERYQHLRDGIQASTAVRLAVELLMGQKRRTDGSRSEFLISEEQCESLKPLVLKRIANAAKDGRLRKMEGLSYLLGRWKEWADEDVVKKWLASQIKASRDALWILKVFLSTMQTSGEKVTFTRYLRLDWLSQFVNIDTIESLTKSYDITTLPQDDMRALRAFRQALKWRDEGKPDEYVRDLWRGENPLVEDS